MRRFAWGLLVTAAVLIVSAGCTTASDTPATAPSTTATDPTTTVPPTTTTVVATTTTTTLDRTAEIEAIFLDLERRRLQAILDQDEDGLLLLYSNDEFGIRSLAVLDSVSVVDPQGFDQRIVDVLVDRDDCLSARVARDHSSAIIGGSQSESTYVLTPTADGSWGIAWVGEDWLCDGPHPFSSS